jgi:hypothetical protein
MMSESSHEIPGACMHGVSLKVHCCQCQAVVIQGIREYQLRRERERSSAWDDGNGMDEGEEG